MVAQRILIGKEIDRLVEHWNISKNKAEGGISYDASDCRAPYPATIIYHSQKEHAVLVVKAYNPHSDEFIKVAGHYNLAALDRFRHELIEIWEISLVLEQARLLNPFTALCGIDVKTQRLALIVGEDQYATQTLKRMSEWAFELMNPNIDEELRGGAYGRMMEAMGLPRLAQYLPWELIRSVFLVFKLMGTKNIIQRAIVPPPKLQKARKKRGARPLFTWHELLVAPISSSARRDSKPTGDLQAVHWVRGHFKEYTAEKPLFGRVTGRFWFQPHLAGRDKERFVEKTYVIEEGKEGD